MRISDWSSDVCSSDLDRQVALDADVAGRAVEVVVQAQRLAVRAIRHAKLAADRVGGNDAPRGCVLEAVEKSWLADDLLGECGGRRQQDQHAQDSSNRHSRESGSTLQQRQLVNPVTCAAGSAKARAEDTGFPLSRE